MADNVYFAQKPIDEIGPEIEKRMDRFYNFMTETGLKFILDKSMRAIHGYSMSGDNNNAFVVRRAGKQGEFRLLRSNVYSTAKRHVHALIMQEKTVPEISAKNTDNESLSNAATVQSYLSTKSVDLELDTKISDGADLALYALEGFINTEWNRKAGEPIAADPETGEQVYEGDLKYTLHNVMDVARDVSLKSWEDVTWVIIRRFENKYEIAARYPEFAEKIIGLKPENRFERQLSLYWNQDEQSDIVPFYELRHLKTSACPDGLQVFLCNRDTVFEMNPLPYGGPLGQGSLNLRRIVADVMRNSPFGWSPGLETLGIQDALDKLTSAAVTNAAAYAVGAMAAVKGHGLNIRDVSGMRFMEVGTKDHIPVPVNFPVPSPEHMKLYEQKKNELQTAWGVNNVTMGNADQVFRDPSGAMLALVDQTAIRYASKFTRSIKEAVRGVYEDSANTCARFITSKKIQSEIGKSKRNATRILQASAFTGLNITVSAGNPLAQTVASKMALARLLIDAGAMPPGSGKQLLEIVTTGSLEDVFEGPREMLIAAKAEADAIVDGEVVTVIQDDAHWLKIRALLNTTADLQAKRDPNLVQVVANQITLHLQQWAMMDPNVVRELGGPPFIPPMMPGMMPPGPGGPGTPPGGPPHPGQPPMGPGDQHASPGQPGPPQPHQQGPLAPPRMPPPPNMPPPGTVNTPQAKLPKLPINPSTNEPWNPLNGGGVGPQ